MKKTIIPLFIAVSCAFTSCGIFFEAKPIKDSEKSVRHSVELDPDSITELYVSLSTADCSISIGDVEKISVSCKFTATGNEKKLDELLDPAKIFTEVTDGVLTVETRPEKSPDVLGVLTDGLLETEMEIVLPRNVDKYKVDINIGTLKMNGLSGGFEICDNIGDVDLNGVSITADSEFVVNTGSFDLGLNEVGECGFKALVNVGDIKVDTGDLGYSKDPDDDSKVLIDGKCSAELISTVGSADIK